LAPREISEGALALLRIAKENDSYGALAKNAALLTVLEFAQTLLSVAQEENDGKLKRLLAVAELPSCFVKFVAACLRSVRDQQEKRFRDKADRDGVLFVTDFDRHALQAFAETMAELVWAERRADDFDGPRLHVVIGRLKKRAMGEVWFGIVRNYIGNLLQHYFSAARIREQVRNLPVATESDLRLVEASRVAEYAQELAAGTDTIRSAMGVINSLDLAVTRFIE
jgi:hypothetical protein